MKRFFYITIMGLILAGIVHILIVLLIPSYATKDAWAKLTSIGEPWKFSTIARPGEKTALLPSSDPYFRVSACRFDLSEAPLLVEAKGNVPFWSAALFDRRGQNIYSFNDRTSVDQRLTLIVVNPVQMAQLRKNPPEESDDAVLVQSNTDKGFIIIRAFQTNSSWNSIVTEFLQSATCKKFEFNAEQTNP